MEQEKLAFIVSGSREVFLELLKQEVCGGELTEEAEIPEQVARGYGYIASVLGHLYDEQQKLVLSK